MVRQIKEGGREGEMEGGREVGRQGGSERDFSERDWWKGEREEDGRGLKGSGGKVGVKMEGILRRKQGRRERRKREDCWTRKMRQEMRNGGKGRDREGLSMGGRRMVKKD